jgi:uncharacterized protein YlxW (UPF0749 family)
VQDGARHARAATPPDGGSALGRTLEALRRRRRERSGWAFAVPVVVLAAGVLFAASAHTAQGTDLRAGQRAELVQLIRDRNTTVSHDESTAAALRADVERATRDRAVYDRNVSGAQKAADRLASPAGLSPVHGPAVTVRLDDAPTRPDGRLPDGATVNDVVVHQQDVQAVVNALWAGGAEAMTIMNQRVISTGAVRCVGNTLLLYGRTYSPPFVITAIGPADAMMEALDDAPAVDAFRRDARTLGLGYRVTMSDDVKMPGYTGQVSAHFADVPGPTPSAAK